MIFCERKNDSCSTDIKGMSHDILQELCEIMYQLMKSLAEIPGGSEALAVLTMTECVRGASRRFLNVDGEGEEQEEGEEDDD